MAKMDFTIDIDLNRVKAYLAKRVAGFSIFESDLMYKGRLEGIWQAYHGQPGVDF
jgi:hypothetical protein